MKEPIFSCNFYFSHILADAVTVNCEYICLIFLVTSGASLCRGQSSPVWCVTCHERIAWHGESSTACWPVIRVNIAPSAWADQHRVKVPALLMFRPLRSQEPQQVSRQSSLAFLPISPCISVSAMPCNQIGTRIVKCAFEVRVNLDVHSAYSHGNITIAISHPPFLMTNNSSSPVATHGFHYCQDLVARSERFLVIMNLE